jgi:hypothetical protein
MKRDVMLPKFNLPGQSTWLMKGLWIAGAVVLVQVGVVGTLLLRDRIGDSEPAPAQEAPAPAAVVKAPEPASAGEPPSEPGVQPARELAGVRPGSPSSPGPRMNRGFGPSKPGMARLRGKGRRGGDRVFARTSLGARKGAAPKAGRKGALPGGPRANGPRPAGRNGKPDAIDQLLRNFK